MVKNTEDYFSTSQLKSELRTRALQGASATIIAQIINFCLSTIGTIILARILTPDDFGLVAMALTFSLLLQNFGFNGFTEAIIQRAEINHKLISTLFWINFLISSGLTLLFIASGPFIAWFYNNPKLTSVVAVIAASIFFTGLSTEHLALLNRNMKFYKTSIITVIALFVSVVLSVFLALWGWGYWALVMRWVLLPFATTVSAWILCEWRPRLPTRGTDVWPLLKFAFNTYGNFIMNYFRRDIDKILLGKYFGAQALGFYDRAYQLANMLPNQLVNPIAHVAISTLSKVSDNHERYRQSYLEVISVIAFIGMPMSAIITLTGNDLIVLILGPQWREAGQLFSIFGVSIGVMLIYLTHGWLHLSLGTPDRWLRWGVFSLIATIVCFVVGIYYGAIGLATAYSVSMYILLMPALWYAGKYIDLTLSSIFSVLWKYYLSAACSGLLCWFILYFYRPTANIFVGLNTPVKILISASLCFSVYLFFIIVTHKDLKPLFHFIRVLREMIPGFSTTK